MFDSMVLDDALRPGGGPRLTRKEEIDSLNLGPMAATNMRLTGLVLGDPDMHGWNVFYLRNKLTGRGHLASVDSGEVGSEATHPDYLNAIFEPLRPRGFVPEGIDGLVLHETSGMSKADLKAHIGKQFDRIEKAIALSRSQGGQEWMLDDATKRLEFYRGRVPQLYTESEEGYPRLSAVGPVS